MTHAATAAPTRDADTGAEPPTATSQWQTTACCPACDTVVTFTFTVTADAAAPGGVFRTGPTWDRCPECGDAVAVPGCEDAGHVRVELLADGQSLVTCFVCADRRRPIPVGAAR